LLNLNEELCDHIEAVCDKARNPSVALGEKRIDQKQQFNARHKAEAEDSVLLSLGPKKLDPNQFVHFEDN
jgi:hypothetical protein